MFKRIAVLSAISLVTGIATGALATVVAICLLWGFLTFENPGDPSNFDTVGWSIILIPSLWLSVFIVFGVVGGVVSYVIARKRYRRMTSRERPGTV